jgi:2,3-bisphosphoglycerate-independent phosphoglycerate mutase
MNNKHILIILDGYGIAEDPEVSAIDNARKPFLDSLFQRYPHATLEASELAVGLPEGQMGNSEVGHMNLGAGRIVYQEITRIDTSIEEEDFFENKVLVEAAQRCRERGSTFHLMGLFSDGGVHSSNEHLFALLELARRNGVSSRNVCVHAFTDGRDTDPHGAIEYAREFEQRAAEIGVGRLVSVVGRYYAMDRDRRWQRTKRAYELLVHGRGSVAESAEEALSRSYENGVTDEFVEPVRIGKEDEPREGRIARGDVVVFYNFRADRARQITHALVDDDFEAFEQKPDLDIHFVCLTPYDEAAFDLPVAFPKVNLTSTLGEVISGNGLRQCRAAETEKYPHVTYFFSGGREEPFDGEDRILVPSPKVATYDLQPEMSAPELASAVSEAIAQNDYALVVLNFANPDMVGHTGVFQAAVQAVEAVDEGARQVVETAMAHGYSVQIIADHGNADKMRNPDGSPHTAHTTALVPHLIIQKGFEGPIKDGKLADVAPTILAILGLPAPEEMTGNTLL